MIPGSQVLSLVLPQYVRDEPNLSHAYDEQGARRGNATAIEASANVVVTGIARRNGHPTTFWTFTRYGLVVTTVTIALCVPSIALRYFVLA